MDNRLITKEFENQVKNKFNLYNSLFLNLPYPNVSNIGILIPLLHNVCKQGLEAGKDPLETLDSFFSAHTNIQSEKEKLDFMFRVIQYVERQVVLYDSVEDAAFSQLATLNNHLSLKDYIHISKNKDNASAMMDKLSNFSTRIVFTAHPTQFYPPSVLDIIAKLKLLILDNEINEVDVVLRQLGLTSLINSEKPTPFEEAKNIIYFLRNVYYEAVTDLYASLKNSIGAADFENTDILKFGFWPGGDRDGNPFVTADITMQVADELRMTLMKCYYGDIKNLSSKLTFRGVERKLEQLREGLYVTMFDRTKTISYEDILNPLNEIKDILVKQYSGLYLEDLERVIDKVKIFKTHFATLDIRQNHSVHLDTVEAILKNQGVVNNSIEELSREDLIAGLLRKDIEVHADGYPDGIIKDTIQSIQQLKLIQSRNGEDGCNRYIISNSEDIFSVLFVQALLCWCGYGEEDIPIDIVPLFESMDGMTNSEEIMQELYDIDPYRTHVRKRNDVQTVMLGFSDGTKDGGYLQANWSIFQTKENLSKVCDNNGIKVIFFDGRGGPPARGGGKSHRFYASQTEKIANHGIQLTIQGQTITSIYGTKEQFRYNCEQLLTAGLSQSVSENKIVISEENRALITRLAAVSFDKYTALKNHDMFISYLEDRSTLKYYSKANIGSRPAKRGGKKKLELDDLRAISFVGSWSQLKQNVPGYFGVGTALKALVDEGKLDQLKRLFSDVPFFKALILNSMMSLSKCYFELTAYIAKDESYKAFWNILLDEYELSKKMTLLISGYDFLMEEEPVSRSSIAIREDIVLPLLVIQQCALQKIKQGSELSSTYEKIVERSLYGNINASRNSA